MLLAGVGFLLEHLPGWYIIEDFQDEWALDAPEGIALQALDSMTLEVEAFFETSALHRISRNAEIRVPADTRISLRASMVPVVIDNEAVARPHTWDLHASRPLVFIYRGVTVARAKRMRIDPEDPHRRVRAVGTYRVLSALTTAHRYHRQKTVRRDYQVPDTARVQAAIRFRTGHPLPLLPGASLITGPQPPRVTIENLIWDRGIFTGGRVAATAGFENPEPLLNQLLKRLVPEPVEVGRIFALELRRLHTLRFEDQHLRFHVDGTLSSSNSSRIQNVFEPGFRAHLRLETQLPEKQYLREAKATLLLKNIYSIDFNRSNPIFDDAVRGFLRDQRSHLRHTWIVQEEFPEIRELPASVYLERFQISALPDGGPKLDVQATVSGPPSGEL